ncbi:MAG: (deoxy)nucleoside triphosphate pyrophosphohydrolase, partial [Prevotella sp.]
LDWDIFVGKKLDEVSMEYPDFTIELCAYLCRPGEGDFKLLEHLDSKWLTKEELRKLNWTEADRKLVDKIFDNE